MSNDAEREGPIIEDRPPVFRTWAGVYALVFGILALLTLLFHLFTRHYQ